MASGGGLTTRRRSNSNAVPAPNAESAQRSSSRSAASAANSSPANASTRSKRTRRGLALPTGNSSNGATGTSLSPRTASRGSTDLIKNGVLRAVDDQGNSFQVIVKLEGELFLPQDNNDSPQRRQTTPTSRKRTRALSKDDAKHNTPSTTAVATKIPLPLGHDGNTFYCQVCGGVGDVVCCDGCPHVYHRNCVPASPSRSSLENDDDPWYCPDCFPEKHRDEPEKAEQSKIQSSDSEMAGEDDSVVSTGGQAQNSESDDIVDDEAVATEMRSKAVPEENSSAPRRSTRTRSNSTINEDIARNKNKSKEDEEIQESNNHQTEEPEQVSPKQEKDTPEQIESTEGGLRTRVASRKRTRSDASEMNDNTDKNDAKESPRVLRSPPPTKKRLRPSLPSSKVKENLEALRSPGNSSTQSERRKKRTEKEKDKKKKKSTEVESPDLTRDDKDYGVAAYPYSSNGAGTFKAIPAFFFFLNESRQKIERSLSRKHRIFNRLPKGLERNTLVAREGALWWAKLRDSEVRRYMNMSMRDFEQRIIEWKEEKNLHDMLSEEGNVDRGDSIDGSWEDEQLTYQNHNRLYLGTTVGCKPFKPDADTSHNIVLLELLQDMRFHPMPMFMAQRAETEYGEMDFERITIPYFDVHGPFSTSVGDECFGCARGWMHDCHVLKRRIPAVEHRAKLQPPLSSLMATRIGLGLRTRSEDAKETLLQDDSNEQQLFARHDLPEYKEAKTLLAVPCDSLAESSSRADDIVQFIEEAVSMKVPEPPRPPVPGSVAEIGQKRRPMLHEMLEDTATFNKCGRCRTVIQTDTGCIQCRRAQLVINMSRRPSQEDKTSKSDKKQASLNEQSKGHLKVQTVMCGRVNMKEGTGEYQNDSDLAIANGILRQRWMPFSVLPPKTLQAPTPKSKHHRILHRGGEKQVQDDNVDLVMEDFVESSNMEPDLTSETGGTDDGSHGSGSKDALEQEDDGSSIDASQPDNHRPGSKRLRSARIAGNQNATQSDEEEERQSVALRYKEEATELHMKCLEVACCGILSAMMRRDPLLLFAEPVTAEGYASIIKNPIHFGRIRGNVLQGKYTTLGSFTSDCRLLCTNALTYNPPGSIYWKTAKELLDVLTIMQKRASDWMGTIKDAHAFSFRRLARNRTLPKEGSEETRKGLSGEDWQDDDPFDQLRKSWPDAVKMLENSEWLRLSLSADFMRTKENETAYYGALAVRRAAAAAEAALASYPDSCGIYNPVSKRSHAEDEALQQAISEHVSQITNPVQLKEFPSWREEAIVRVMRRAQSRRLDGMFGSQNGCARCDANHSDSPGVRKAKMSQPAHLGRNRRKNNEISRVDASRKDLSTGMASKSTRDRIQAVLGELHSEKDLIHKAKAANEVAVSVRGSSVHGWGLFADQFFKPGDVVAEYIGEYVSLAVTEAREKMYQEQRIQDYQFRVDDHLVIDATMRGGHGRYINHNCNPNCIAKVIPGAPPNENLKRVIIIAQRPIKPREELTYDYQFPLELDLQARIPCNCQSDQCRGFMNWDLPEKGSNNRVLRTQKRGANMRDRIRRLGRPLKSERGDDENDDDNNSS